MKITVTKTTCGELKAGDLFSHVDEWYWKHYLLDKDAVGHKVFIRTEYDCKSPDYNPNDTIYLVNIEKN